MKVLSFGSLNIDHTYQVPHFVGKGETLSSTSMQDFCGGKGLNQSVALAKAGMTVYHAGAVGQDGKMLLDMLEQSGVNNSLVQILNNVPTGHAIIQNDETGDNCILLYGGANQAITTDYIDIVMKNFIEGDILLLQNEINNLQYIIDRAYEKKMKIVLNPSPMNEKILALTLDKISMFLLNEIEGGQILRAVANEDITANLDEMDSEELLKELTEAFPNAQIVLTLGSDGSMYSGDGAIIYQPCIKTTAVDTTAAGDTYTGFFLAGISKGLDVAEAMLLASRASAIAVSRRGAAPSIPTMSELEN